MAALAFDRCRGRRYATQLRACQRAQALHGSYWHCARCGHFHAGRRGLGQRLVDALARRAA